MLNRNIQRIYPAAKRAINSGKVVTLPEVNSQSQGQPNYEHRNPVAVPSGEQSGFSTHPELLQQGGNTANDPKLTQRRIASQGKTLTKVQISNVIRTLFKGAKNLPKINIVSSLQEAFPNTPTDVTALYDPNTNQVFVEEGRHTSVEQLSKDLYHEVTAHYGLRGFYGEGLGTLLENILKLSGSWQRSGLMPMLMLLPI